MPLVPVKKLQIADLVLEQLREAIYRGEYKVGERLPAERELAETMRVSRSSVRKAITSLLAMGYVENRANHGTYVRLPEASPPHDPLVYTISPGHSSLDELMEVRIGLECQGVALAAERATEMDLAFLELAFSEMHSSQADREKAKDADMRFHMGIAYATHNSVHVDLTRRFYDYMFHSINQLHSLLYEKNKNLGIIDQQHFKILDAIKCRDGDSARRYMLQHITFLRGFLKEISAAD